MHLAFYGTLRDPDILRLVAGEEIERSFHRSITVRGWACLRIEGQAYPLLRSDSAATAVFHLYHDCSEVSWRRLVAYEGDEYGAIELEIEGEMYRFFMAEDFVTATSEPWDLATFQARDKRSYCSELEGDIRP